MTGQAGDLECVAAEILEYLRRRPEATDTMEGILHWWLPRIRLEEAAETVEQALRLLQKRQLVEQVRVAPRGLLYRRVRAARTGSASKSRRPRAR